MWKQHRYMDQYDQIKKSLENGAKKPTEFMQEYKRAIQDEDYERAAAITDALRPLNYYTKDTHKFIDKLWNG